jgi:hypothetical protein
MHCRGNQKEETTAVWGKWKADKGAKWSSLTAGQTSASLAAALFPCSLSEWDPWYTSQEQAWFETEGGNFLLYRWWRFTDGCIAIPESLAPTFVKQFHKGTHSGKTALETTLPQHFYVPKFFIISKTVVKGTVCVSETIPNKGRDVNIYWYFSTPTQDG